MRRRVVKRFFASLLGRPNKPKALPGEEVRSLDPRSILFSVATISDDTAPLLGMDAEAGGSDLVFHEDEWSQIEFFPKARLQQVQRVLEEYKAFEAANRAEFGWRQVYVRKLQRLPVVVGPEAVEHIADIVGVRPGTAPLLHSAGAIVGRVAGGFTLPLGGDICLYGYADADGVPVLGALVGEQPNSTRLTDAFAALSRSDGLVLVDWRRQLMLLEADVDGRIRMWQP
jgi:hypothetical protein